MASSMRLMLLISRRALMSLISDFPFDGSLTLIALSFKASMYSAVGIETVSPKVCEPRGNEPSKVWSSCPAILLRWNVTASLSQSVDQLFDSATF